MKLRMKPILAVVAGIRLVLPLTASETTGAAGENELPPCCREALDAGQPFTDGSIYQLESKWTSDVGKEIRLGVLRGKPQVIVMFFAKCEFACPILVRDLQQIESNLPESLRDGIGFTLVSFDTDNDTVEALHEYRDVHGLSPRRWTLLRGGKEGVRELAALLGINYKQDARGQFAHSNLITILNADGEIVHQVKGLQQPVEETVELLMKLAEPNPSSKK
jgi:protein SCO1/2